MNEHDFVNTLIADVTIQQVSDAVDINFMIDNQLRFLDRDIPSMRLVRYAYFECLKHINVVDEDGTLLRAFVPGEEMTIGFFKSARSHNTQAAVSIRK